jgi:hypothetical protein
MRIITLIHGTWAREAPWTQEGSLLVRALRAADPEATIERLKWSGGNSHAARLEAAARLVHRIRGCHRRHPAAKHYVIAHSHGGNVVRYALSLAEVSTALRGVVCLSTPFIMCGKPEGKELWPRMGMLLFLGYVLVKVLIGDNRIHFLGISPSLVGLLLTILLGFLMMAPILFFLLVAKLGSRTYRLWPSINKQELLDSFEGASPSPDKFLIVRPGGDEADMGLKLFQLLTWLSNRVVKRLNGLYVTGAGIIGFVFGMNPKLRVAVAVLTLAAFSVFSRVWLRPLMKDTSDAGALLLYCGAATIWILLFGLGVCFWLALAGYKPERLKISEGITADMAAPYEILARICNGVLGFLYFPLILVASLFTVAFGWDMPVFSLFLKFSVEPLPPGNFCVSQLKMEDAPLSHSLPYNDPAVISGIIRWMKRDELDPA